MKLHYSQEVQKALNEKRPILALESTIITHGLPRPRNLTLATELETMAREQGVTPATIAVFEGCLKVGLSSEELTMLAQRTEDCFKFSSFDLPVAQGLKLTGSTTVAGTCHIAHKAGLKVFATGGIGGVHQAESSRMDISHDIKALSENPLVVVSSGAKCILDLESTLEHLETLGVPLVGWQTNEFPAFYYNDSGLKISHKVTKVNEIANIAKHLKKSALLVANPVPLKDQLPKEYVKKIISEAHKKAKEEGISGKKITPYLLDFLCKRSKEKTLETNCSLIRNNVKLACKIAKSFSSF